MDSHKERHPKSSVTTLDAPATVNNNNSSSSTLAHAHVNANRDNHAKNHKTATSSTTNGTDNPRPSALPEAAPATATVNAADRPKPSTESSGAKSDSEAETVVLPGKNGYSPAKVRKTIKHEERSDEEGEVRGHSDVDVNHAASLRRDAAKSLGPNARKGNDGSTASMLGKRKRYKHDNLRDENYAGNSSGLSSVPTSPVHTNRSSLSKRADSDSEASRSSSPRHSTADRAKSSERGPKRRLPHDDDERPRIQRQRSPGPDHSTDRDKVKTKRAQTAPHRESSATAKRSVSPRARHRRSVSTHLAPPNSTNGLSQKKKKVPAPLRSTRDRYSADYHSDDSSASGSPHPRGSRVRSLATPAAESAISPARMPPHKKHRDNIGRTFLARAVAGGDIALVRQRLEEWPDDIDLADNAGNTPLQIAALEGADDIVKLLLDHGCDIHCINNDKDTPLLDAVENGHLEVVKLLLDAGVNPRRGNVNGDEPLDLVNEDADNADEIRKILLAARKKSSEQRRFSDDQIGHDKDDGRSSHGTGSPRHSPPMQPPNASLSGRRATSGRSTKTSNHLLYMPLDSKTLRAAAGKGDEETVIRILQVRDGLDDSESLVLAARGGHDNVINLLLGLGGANPDPPPVKSMPSDVATPILAAIGRDNLDVIKLLLGQAKFDATRKTNGETYYEIARRRAGPRWREEEELLKEAYQAQIKKKKKSATKQSPESKRDMERKSNRSENGSSISTVHKRKTSAEQSASEPLAKKSSVADPKSDRPKSISSTKQNESALSKEKELKRGPGRPRKEERPSSTNVSDSESAPLGPPKSSAKPPKRSDSEAAMTSETEAHKPRRKLVSGKDLKGERDKQRRASITSTSSTTSAKDRERPTIRENLNPDVSRSIIPRSSSDPELVNDKSLDRARKLKRDDSRNRLSAIRGDSPIKRPRSRTPPRSESQDSAARKLDENGQVKRRRLDSEQRLNSSPDRKLEKKAAIDKSSTKDRDVSMTDAPSSDHQDRPVKSKEHRLNTEASSSKIPKRDDQERKHLESRKLEDEAKQERTSELKAAREAARETAREIAREAAREAKLQEKRQGEVRVKKEPDDDDKKTRKDDDERRRRKEEDEQRRKRKEQEEEKRRLEDEKRARLAKEKAKEEKAEKAREEEEKRKQDEAREAREAKRKEEEAKRRADEIKRQQEEAEAREKKLKAEAEARQREEEERKRFYLEQQRLKNEEMERRREQRIREQRLEQQRLLREREEARLAKLPPLLRWFDMNSQPATPEIASYFCRMQGVRFDTINPDASGTADGRDQWLLNTQVALLLGEKDLQLTRYTAWPRYPASELAKRALWRVESDRYALTSSELCDFGDGRVSFREAEKVKEQSLPLFLSLDLFFVKLSDFMFIVPKFPHLRNLKMTVEYRELPPNPSFLNKWAFPPKWKDDSADDGAVKFAPESKTYLNGTLERKSRPSLALPSKKPFPEQRIPRRGFAPVPPDDPEYESLCREQGLSHLLSISAQTNGLAPVKPHLNGMSPPDSDISLNDDAYASAVKPKSEEAHGLSNGINGVW